MVVVVGSMILIISTLAGDIIYSKKLNNHETIKQLIKDIHNEINEYNYDYLELVYNDTKVKYDNVLSIDNINDDDDNNINLTIIKRNINLYDFLNYEAFHNRDPTSTFYTKRKGYGSVL